MSVIECFRIRTPLSPEQVNALFTALGSDIKASREKENRDYLWATNTAIYGNRIANYWQPPWKRKYEAEIGSVI